MNASRLPAPTPSPLARVAGFVYGLYALLAATLSALVIGTTMALPLLWMRRGPRERFTIQAAVVFGWTVVRLIMLARPRIHGTIDLPADQGALIICNHRSWLDPPVLAAWTRANGLSKREILYLPIIGFYGWLTGAVFFDRRHAASRHAAKADVMTLLRAGCRVVVFPEGTRTRTGALREKVHLNLVVDCHEAGIPVVPCAVWGTERALPTRPAAIPLQAFHLMRGHPLWPRDFDSGDAFARAAWDQVRAHVDALQRGEGKTSA